MKAQNAPEKTIFPTVSFQEIFDSNGVKGAFILYDLKMILLWFLMKPEQKKAFFQLPLLK